jgi:serine protease Do
MLGRSRVVVLSLVMFASMAAIAGDVPGLMRDAKVSVVAIGTHQPLRNPAFRFTATGFVVGDGLTVITNAHAIPASIDTTQKESLAIARPKGNGFEFDVWTAEAVRVDRQDDLAVVRFKADAPLPALKLAATARVAEGNEIVLIGYPIGSALGLVPAIHKGTIAALPPMALPQRTSGQVDARMVRRLREEANAFIYQLDVVAYPGNSGSPVFSVQTGEVIAIINAGLAKSTREAMSTPSGISYAVPVELLHKLLQAAK